MPEKVSGFLTRDGAFYHTSAEAQRHEAQVEITSWCQSQNPPFKPEVLLSTIDTLSDPIQEYLHASEEIRDAAFERTKALNSEEFFEPDKPTPRDAVFTEAAEDRTDDDEAENTTAPILEQPADRSKSVPHMGRRTRST